MTTSSFAFLLFAAVGQVLCQSPPGDVVGNLTVGYQGWFATPTDGSPRGLWIHWARNLTSPPRAGNVNVEIYPDMREYNTTYATQLGNLGNGQPARVFSSWDQSSVNIHFEWMRVNNIDTVALQRFASLTTNPIWMTQLNGIADRVRNAAHASGRKYFIQYDVTDWPTFDTAIVPDINNNFRDQHMATAAYARQNGKPVICIWGVGFGDRPNKPTETLNLINQLKVQYYVICGVPRLWRTDSMNATYFNVYRACNMIQPWTVGGFGTIQGVLNYKNTETADLLECSSRGIDYQPVVWPGSAWSNIMPAPRNENPRLNGQFMWRQFMNLRELLIPSVYIAMFDEFDEGTAIAKAAENASMIPTDQYFLTLDADGGNLSSDFYLRLTRDGRRLIRGEIVASPNAPYVPPTVWRV